jgi:hypothetical protein
MLLIIQEMVVGLPMTLTFCFEVNTVLRPRAARGLLIFCLDQLQ